MTTTMADAVIEHMNDLRKHDLCKMYWCCPEPGCEIIVAVKGPGGKDAPEPFSEQEATHFMAAFSRGVTKHVKEHAQ